MKKILYHGSLSNFEKFDVSFLWKNISDLLSNLWFHFTEDKNLAERLFSVDYNNIDTIGYLYTVEVDVFWEIEVRESELVLDMLSFGVENWLVTKTFFNRIKNLHYWDSFWHNSIIHKLYNNWKRKTSPNYIDKQNLALHYRDYLIKQGINVIKYKNEIEWSEDNRYDYIILNTKDIKIIKKDIIK